MTARIDTKRSVLRSLHLVLDEKQQIDALRVTWLLLTVSVITVFVFAVPVFYDQVRVPCITPECLPWQRREQLPAPGPSLDFYAKFGIVRDAIFAGLFCLFAAFLALRGRSDRMALFTACVLVAFFGGTFPETTNALGTTGTFWRLVINSLGCIGGIGLVLFFSLFPTGHFAPPWTRLIAVASAVLSVIAYTSPQTSKFNPNGAPFIIGFLALLLVLAIAQWSRYRNYSTPAERQQTKWVVFGFGISFLGFFVSVMILPMIGPDIIPNRAMFRLVGITIASSFLLLIPMSIAFGVLKFKLWEIDLFISRALVYGLLTALVIGIYVSTVGALTALLPSSGDTLVSLFVTGLLAVLFQPLRLRLQRAVNRLVYGERDDPYGVLSRLGERLGTSLNQRDVLPLIVETVTQSLRVPYAAIALVHRDFVEIAASHGAMSGEPHVWHLLYQQERVGELHVSARGPGEHFSSSDRRLLDQLSHQAGAAIHAVRLSAELQRSRERLVSSQEEERKRLRRDLHDGLGPQLASQTLTLDAARKMMPTNPAAADHLLDELRGHIQSSVTDIRRLVYALRPPSLDELGLVGAISETIRRYEGSGTHFHFEVPATVSSLPAAVEVAGLRITQEALTNVVKHAGARSCVIRLQVDPSEQVLRLEIEDDGTGLASNRLPGVGMISMRERAMELGGHCEIESLALSGTRVFAMLPLRHPS